MVKHRQVDFHKTKLRPGRTIARGRNVTNTNFKAKKIIMPSQLHKEKVELTVLDCINNINCGTFAVRRNSLNHLSNLLRKRAETFPLYLAEILDCVTKSVIEADDSHRNASVKVLTTVFELTPDSKISSFCTLIINILSCAMTHSNIKVKASSLDLLNVLLKTHPNLICHSMTILKNLLDLLSGPSYRRIHAQVAKQGQKTLMVNYGDSVYSQGWRIQVLDHMTSFLKATLKDKNHDTDCDEQDCNEQEIYWNRERPLYLEIYANGGLKPVDIEKSVSLNINLEIDLIDPLNFKDFFLNFIPLLSDIFIEEIAGDSSVTDDDLLKRETIDNLCVLLQVLSCVGECVELFSDGCIDLRSEFISVFVDKMWRNLERFPFIPRGSVFDTKAQVQYQHPPCVQLNLAVCYLYSTFLLETESIDDSTNHKIFSYIKNLFEMPYEIRYDSIPMLLKIIRNYFHFHSSSVVSDFIKDVLYNLSLQLKASDDRCNKTLLISFFIKLSLDSAYSFLIESDAMKKWFQWLLAELVEMTNADKVDRKLLKNIKMIANRKYKHFLDSLAQFDAKIIKGLLEYDNEDVRDTVIFLIYAMRVIPGAIYEAVCPILLEDDFPVHCAIRLVRLLSCKLCESNISAENRVNFIQFLINISIDSLNIYDDKWANYDLNECTKALFPCKDASAFNIFPSLFWKKHSKLFEVCHKSLNLLNQSTVSKIVLAVMKDILDHTRNLPVHSVIAMLRLYNPKMKETYYYCQVQDLTFSSLVFISVLTTGVADDDWYRWNVIELMNSLNLNRKTVSDIIRQLEYDSNDKSVKEGIFVYHLLRMCNFFYAKNLFVPDDRDRLLIILENLKKNCTDKNIHQQPLFMKLVNIFNYYG